MNNKPMMLKMIYLARDFRSRIMFNRLKQYCHGTVLDVGGSEFYRKAIKKGITFNTWTVLEYSESHLYVPNDERVQLVLGDGCYLNFPENCFDTVLNIQVLEHVFDPEVMVKEMARVLNENGHLILLIPQTSTIHAVPYHYYNFTRFWIEEVMQRSSLKILEIKPLGGVWSSMASHLIIFFLQSIRYPGVSTTENKRNLFFYILYPFMVLFALIAFPICMLLSIGDLSEEPNNHLVVAKKILE